MAVADVSARNQDAVRSFQKRFEQEAVIYPTGAHEPNQTDIGRILHAGHTGQVGPRIGAPIADEGQYVGFGVRRHRLFKIEDLRFKIEDLMCSVYLIFRAQHFSGGCENCCQRFCSIRQRLAINSPAQILWNFASITNKKSDRIP